MSELLVVGEDAALVRTENALLDTSEDVRPLNDSTYFVPQSSASTVFRSFAYSIFWMPGGQRRSVRSVAIAFGLCIAALAFVTFGPLPLPGRLATFRQRGRDDSMVKLNWSPDIDSMNCAFDVTEAILRAATLGIAIDGTVEICRNQTSVLDEWGCAKAVTSIIGNAAFVAGSVAGTLSHCSRKINFPAICTAALGNFVALAAIIFSGLGSLPFGCDGNYTGEEEEEEELLDLRQKRQIEELLMAGDPSEKTQKFRDMVANAATALPGNSSNESVGWDTRETFPTARPLPTMVPLMLAGEKAKDNDGEPEGEREKLGFSSLRAATCWAFVVQIPALLLKLIVIILDAAHWCGPESENDQKMKSKCESNLVSLTGGLVFLGHIISGGIVACQVHVENSVNTRGGICTSEITKVVGGGISMAAAAMNLDKTCGNPYLAQLDPAKVLPDDSPLT